MFLVLWGPTLAGRYSLVAGDVLHERSPWAAEPAARPARNVYVGDPITQFVPWLDLVQEAFREHRMPLWNPYSLSGTPLLANNQSSPFGAFTLLTLPFAPARGLTIAMLAKLWVAGLGMVVFLRVIGCKPQAAGLGGLAYATSSFMTVWLAYPHTGVAALLPWLFAAVEWLMRTRGEARAAAAVAVLVALQLLAGHAETSMHAALGLGLYVIVRTRQLPTRRVAVVAALSAAVAAGVLIAGIQLVPFLAELASTTLIDQRSQLGQGRIHLGLEELATWLAPNDKGSPGIDGASPRYPIYPEAVGWAGVGALALALRAVRIRSRRGRVEAVALGAMAVAVMIVVYTPAARVIGKLPLVASANNLRFLVVACFAVSALAGIGLDEVLAGANGARKPVESRRIAAAMAAFGLIGLAASGLALAAAGRDLSERWPVGDYAGFWLVVAALAAMAATGLMLAVRSGIPSNIIGTGFVVLALLEAAVVAFPYNPRVPTNEVPPASAVVDWLSANAGDRGVAGVGLDLTPNTSSLLRIRDPRGVDTIINPRVREYWSRADPAYTDEFLYTMLQRPDVEWLAAAGVGLLLTPGDQVRPETEPVLRVGGATVSRVPNARPFAFATGSTVTVSDNEEAGQLIESRPLDSVAVERDGPAPLVTSDGEVSLIMMRPGRVVAEVDAREATTVVFLQSFAAGWKARVDGAPSSVWPANILFQAVDVPRGRHTVDLTYAPRSFRAGAIATALGMLALVAILGAPRLAEHRARQAGG